MEKWIVCACVTASIGFDDMNKSAAHLFVWQPNIKWLKRNKSIAYEKYQWKMNWTTKKIHVIHRTYIGMAVRRVWNRLNCINEEWARKKVAKKEITKSNQWFKLKTETNRQREKNREWDTRKNESYRTHISIHAWDDDTHSRRREKRSVIYLPH